jgi:hypothetical protein
MTPPPPVSIPAEAKIEIVTTEAKDSLRKSARFELHARRVAGKYVFLFGEFMNTGEATLGKPSVTAIYIDKDGKELGPGRECSDHDSARESARPCGIQV